MHFIENIYDAVLYDKSSMQNIYIIIAVIWKYT